MCSIVNIIPMRFNILTLFPDLFPGPLNYSVSGNALKNKKYSISAFDIRKFSDLSNKSVDDNPFGGGAGMVMRADILNKALEFVKKKTVISNSISIYLTPSGEKLDQKMIKRIVKYDNIILICGRYEGVDQRFLDHNNVKEVSIGDYVLAGGEIAALVLIEACIRLIPDVLGNKKSLINESFEDFLLEHPHYTKPAVWKNIAVPKVLRSGNHKMISEWRKKESIKKTKKIRPDLIKLYNKSKD